MKFSNDQLFAAYQKSQLNSLSYSPKREDFEENLARYGKLEYLQVIQSWIESCSENSKAELDLESLMAALNNPTPEIAVPDEFRSLRSREAKFLLEIAYGLASLEAPNHAVPPQSDRPKILVKAGVKTRNWRGLVITKTSTKTRAGGFADIWVLGLCGQYEDKDELKTFAQERGGSWNSYERFWFVPLDGKKHIDILENFWAIAQEAMAELPEILQSHQKVIQISVWNMNDRITQSIITWLTKKAKRANSNILLLADNADVVELRAGH